MYKNQEIDLLLYKIDKLVKVHCRKLRANLDINDLKQYMAIAGLRALKRYDSDKALLNTYLEHRLVGAIYDYIIKDCKYLKPSKFEHNELIHNHDYIKEYTLKEIYNYISNYPENKALGLTLWLQGKGNAKLLSSILGVSQSTFTIWKKQLVADLKVYFKV